MARVPATQLSIEYLQKQGLRVDIVERSIPSHPFPTKKDLFGLFDLIALDREDGTINFIQTTSASNRAARRSKMEQNQGVIVDLVCIESARVYLHSWRKRGPSYEIKVETVYEVAGDGVHLVEEINMPTMKTVRAAWREKYPNGKFTKLNPNQDEGERESKPGRGARRSVSVPAVTGSFRE